MTDDILLTVQEEPDITLEYVEAAIKPETVGHVTPTYEAQTVYPASGTTFGRVDVDAIPDPTAVKEIDSNGDHDVRRFGTARVNVQPTLQTKEVTPTKQTQTVTADTGYDGLESVEVEPIPSEYIVPSGSLDIAENADGIDVSEKATVNVNVPIPPEYIIPTGTKTISENGTGINVREFESVDVDVSDKPTIGLVFGGWDANGRPSTLETVGFTEIPAWFLYRVGLSGNNRGYWSNRLSVIYVNEGVTTIASNAFREINTLTQVYFPSTLTSLDGGYEFYNDNALQLLDFSKSKSVVQLVGTGGIGIPSGCVIRVPQSLLTEWQEATNWSALAGVVWEGT